MKRPRHLHELGSKPPSQAIGCKAVNLCWLIDRGFKVPRTHVVDWRAHARYLADDTALIGELRAELEDRLEADTAYAVRSSADLEDAEDCSFAGQFKTSLDVRGLDGVLTAIWSTWSSALAAPMRAYQARSGSQVGARMAVLVQEMVEPVVSGVAFSKNPITGMDEVVMEAVRGPGTALVQRGASPHRWVHKWGQWLQVPVDHVLPPQVAQQLIEDTRRIGRQFGRDVDLEWVFDGKAVSWVQLRPITTLKDTLIYSNAISKEMLPGLITPLVWSVNIPLVAGVWVNLLNRLVGETGMDPQRLVRRFYFRAYFEMASFGRVFQRLGLPPETLEMMMGIGTSGAMMPRMKMGPGMMRLAPRWFPFMLEGLRFAPTTERALPARWQAARALAPDPAKRLSNPQLLQQVDQLFGLVRRITYDNIVGPLLMYLYNGMLRRVLSQAGIDMNTMDLTRGMDELQRYDPNPALAALHDAYVALPQAQQQALTESGWSMAQSGAIDPQFCQAFGQFLADYGHLSDRNTDFSATPWRETPDLVLGLVRDHSAAVKSDSLLAFEDLSLPPSRRPAARILYRQARRYRLAREAIGSLYTYAYGLFRPLLRQIGANLAAEGVLAQADDIFWLELDEVRSLVREEPLTGLPRRLVEQRRGEMEQAREAVLPTIIYGEQAPPLVPANLKRLTGTPTSPGYFTGPVRTIRGLEDFVKVRQGDVLVIPYSDVGWTPLFAKAGGVIAESGGILSHSSIIAREYCIPAVVSVQHAFTLSDEMVVSIDGFKGEIVVHA